MFFIHGLLPETLFMIFLQSTFFILTFSFYVSQVHNSHKVPIEAERKMIRIVQSSLGIQIGFYNKTLITQSTQKSLKLDTGNREQASLKSDKGDLKPCRINAVSPQSWNSGQKKARQHWTWM